MAAETGRRIVDMVWEDLKPRDFVDRGQRSTTRSRRCSRSAARPTPSCTWSPMARRAGVPLTIDRFDALARRTPLLANMRPAGQVPDGGLLLRRRACARCSPRSATCSTLDARTVNGKTLGENIAGAEVFNRDVILPRDKALVAQRQPRGAARQSRARRRGDQARGGRAAPAAAHRARGRVRRLQRHGGAHRRSRAAGDEGLGAGAAARGPAGRAGHARMGPAADPEEAARARRARHGAHLRRADERHELRRVRAARRAGVVRRRTARAGAGRRPDRARRAGAQAGAQGRATTSSRAAARRGSGPRRSYERGFGALYQQHITQADQGCDFDFLEGTAPTPEPEIH